MTGNAWTYTMKTVNITVVQQISDGKKKTSTPELLTMFFYDAIYVSLACT